MLAQILQDIYRNSPDATLTIKDGGEIAACNQATSTLFGYSTEELLQLSIESIVPNYYRVEFTNPSLSVEAMAKHYDSSELCVEIHAYPQPDLNLTALIIRDISQKKKSSLNHLHKTTELQTLFEVIDGCLIRLDSSGSILDYHIGNSFMLSVNNSYPLGKQFTALFESEIAKQFHHHFDLAKKTGLTQCFEYTQVANNNRDSSYTAAIKPFIDGQHIVFIQQVKSSSHTTTENPNYQTLTDSLPVGIFRCELNGDYIYQNTYWQELTADHTCQLSNLLDCVHAEDYERIKDIWQQITLERVPFNAQFRLKLTANKTAYIQCYAVPEINKTGEIQAYSGSAYNITDNILSQKEIEKHWLDLDEKVEAQTADLRTKNRWLQQTINERKKIELSLSEERNFSATVLDTVGVIIMVCNAEGRIVRLNRRHIDLIGYSEEEIYGKYFYQLLVNNDETDFTLNMFNQLKNNKQRVNYEGTWKTKDHVNKLISWSNTVICNEHNEVIYVVFTGIDITEQRLIEEEARQHQADLIHVSRLSTMGEMATGLAHELNQPLAAIVNYTQGSVRLLAQTNQLNKSEITHALRQVAAQAERAGIIIRKLRDFVKKSEPHRQKSKLEKIVRDSLNFAASDIKRYAATIRLRFKENLPEVYVDAIQIEQVLINLIRNALESMDSNENKNKELIISIFTNNNNELQLSITDMGCGIPQGMDESKVFDAFFTTKPNGMGMGLAISRSIIEAHEGRMWAQRNNHAGCTFHLCLPIVDKDSN